MNRRLFFSLPAMLCVLGGPPMASAAPVQVLGTQYSVSVSAQNLAVGPDQVSRSSTSLNPISDSVALAGDDGSLAEADASAGLFALEILTIGFPCRNCQEQKRAVAGAIAESVLSFAPLFDETASFAFTAGFKTSLGAWYTSAFVRLEDLTTAVLLWENGWNCPGST